MEKGHFQFWKKGPEKVKGRRVEGGKGNPYGFFI